PLRAAGHFLYLPPDLGVEGQDDEPHLLMATKLGAVLVTTNQQHFDPLHFRWQAAGREHSGILSTPEIEPGELFRRLDRAARLLTPEAAHNQLLRLSAFKEEEEARNYLTALTPLP
ncbi:MAG TPA: hypothetical protein VF157_15275, partial [Chloroflexota bacterium]